MNFRKLCNESIKSNKKIRYVVVLDTRGGLKAQKTRDHSTTLLSDEELNMLVYYTTDRWNRLQNLEHKLGKVKETITKYENANTITFFLDKNIILISTEPNSNNSKIASNIWDIIYAKPSKKKSSVKKSSRKNPRKMKVVKKKRIKNKEMSKKNLPGKSKDNVLKLKPKIDNLEKRVNSLYKKYAK